MDEVKRTLAQTAASLEALGAHTKGLGQDLKQMTSRVDRMDAEISSLRGTFARLEAHLVTLFERDAEMRSWREDIESRVKALEKTQPPAASRNANPPPTAHT